MPYARGVGDRRCNPIVFLDISLEGENLEPIGRLTVELRADVVPRTAENFRVLCTGERGCYDGVRLHLKDSRLHRVVRNSHCQGGDLKNGDGTWSRQAYGDAIFFDDENYTLRHVGPGVLSMCNQGPDTNGSAFFLTFAANPRFDNKHVVFGCLADESSLRVLYAIDRLGTDHGRPRAVPCITNCGQLYPVR
ncbi:hypothetical protein CTAYLR_001770 [Chrysophaeum taylorii]|uniref:Peptidyl-prolyl cis-trans isomerase n=1 Tax=Chrysophaeum taylorii TaxID=2483200 RepID=A0AAD7UG71_9STRA|nr:hypothetical protein CTAYLR_001770 [Chrysophaeum taylorii]